MAFASSTQAPPNEEVSGEWGWSEAEAPIVAGLLG